MLQGVYHSPHRRPTLERKYAIKISASILNAALKTSSVQRVVLASSIVANLGGIPPQRFISTTTRTVLPPTLNVYKNVFEAYLLGKVDYAQMFSYAKAAYPKAMKERIFKRGNLVRCQEGAGERVQEFRECSSG